MDQALVYRLLAAKWLEAAEHVESRALKRCYAKRALSYEALAAEAQQEAMQARLSPDGPQPGETRH